MAHITLQNACSATEVKRVQAADRLQPHRPSCTSQHGVYELQLPLTAHLQGAAAASRLHLVYMPIKPAKHGLLSVASVHLLGAQACCLNAATVACV